jgi:hypothetical protein
LTSSTALKKAAKSKTRKRLARKARVSALARAKARKSTTAIDTAGIAVAEMRRAADAEG